MVEWVRVAKRSDLPDGATLAVEVDGIPVCLYGVDGAVHATQDTCPHAEASLAAGWLEGSVIECPLHQARFDVATGKRLSPPATEDLRVFATAIVGEDILVARELS